MASSYLTTLLLLASTLHFATSQIITTIPNDPHAPLCTPAISLMSSCVRKSIGYVTVTNSVEQAACVCFINGEWDGAVFDNAYTECLLYYSTAAPSVYAQLTSDLGTTTFCGGIGGVTANTVAAATQTMTASSGPAVTSVESTTSAVLPSSTSCPPENSLQPVGYPSQGTGDSVSRAESPGSALPSSGSPVLSGHGPAVSAGSSAIVSVPVVTSAPVVVSSASFATTSASSMSKSSTSSSVVAVSSAGAVMHTGVLGAGLGSMMAFLMSLFAL